MKISGLNRQKKRDEKLYKSFKFHQDAYKNFLRQKNEEDEARKSGTVFEESE